MLAHRKDFTVCCASILLSLSNLLLVRQEVSSEMTALAEAIGIGVTVALIAFVAIFLILNRAGLKRR